MSETSTNHGTVVPDVPVVHGAVQKTRAVLRRLLADRVALTGIALAVVGLIAVQILLNFGLSFLIVLAVVGIAFGLYALPVIVAWQRDAVHVALISVVTVATAWTVVGWIGAFIWALFDRTRAEEEAAAVAVARVPAA